MQTEEGETLSLGKDPCPGEGPMPYYSQFLRQGCGSSCEHPCRPGMLVLPILSERDDEQVQLGDSSVRAQSTRCHRSPGTQRGALAPPCRMQMAWESSEAAQCCGLWELPPASPGVVLLCHALSLLTGDLQHCGRTAVPGLTGSLVGLKEPFLYPPLVFLQHLLSVAGVHIDQVEGVTQKGILHLMV